MEIRYKFLHLLPIKERMKGTDTVPFLFAPMATENQIQFIEKAVQELLVDNPSLFLVQIKVTPTNNIKLFLDGDEGITIEKCTRVNRSLYRLLEEEKIFPADDFSLEVSSAGVGEPLLLHRQYVKNIGRSVEVKPIEGELIEGELKSVDENSVVVVSSTGKGKKLEVKEHSITFENIKTTTVQIKF